MKTLQEIKDEVAKKHGLANYLEANVYNRANELADEVAKLYAQSACREQREICARHYDDATSWSAHQESTEEAIKNAPEPKMI